MVEQFWYQASNVSAYFSNKLINYFLKKKLNKWLWGQKNPKQTEKQIHNDTPKNTKQNPIKMKIISLVQLFMAFVAHRNIKLPSNKTW